MNVCRSLQIDFGSIGLLNVNSVETLNLFFQVHEIAKFRELKLSFSEEFAKEVTTRGTVIKPGTEKVREVSHPNNFFLPSDGTKRSKR